jgi:hypothetical protein
MIEQFLRDYAWVAQWGTLLFLTLWLVRVMRGKN